LRSLSESFTRRDICEALGYEPDRGSLYRVLQDLVREGSLRIKTTGTGQKPTTYRQTAAPDAHAAG
jgi:DNA-binding PadR family transcriptional regulator